MKVKGRIKNLVLDIINTGTKEIKINFEDIVKFNEDMVILQDDKPKKLSELKDLTFSFGKKFCDSLLYQLYKDNQLLLFDIKFNKFNKDNKKDYYEIISLELIDE